MKYISILVFIFILAGCASVEKVAKIATAKETFITKFGDSLEIKYDSTGQLKNVVYTQVLSVEIDLPSVRRSKINRALSTAKVEVSSFIESQIETSDFSFLIEQTLSLSLLESEQVKVLIKNLKKDFSSRKQEIIESLSLVNSVYNRHDKVIVATFSNVGVARKLLDKINNYL
tara:strand:+ start:2364 stop:2882 length:519 start_codon:yes stop_codon:yes gene_type:complete